jgi:diguanylate cyclase (GGDEF)-like protein
MHNEPLGVVCMEFDVGFIVDANRRTLIYGAFLSGTLTVLISIIAYLSMSKATEPYFKKLAYTDYLTGYENRMSFEHRLRECGDLVLSMVSVTLIICDVNNLKIINDTQGHKAGDAYIKNTADIIHQNLSGLSKLYRIGGDEFAAIIVDKNNNVIEGIMQALKTEKRLVYKNQPFSCASGAATFTTGIDNSMLDVFKRADDAMYEEKQLQKRALKAKSAGSVPLISSTAI